MLLATVVLWALNFTVTKYVLEHGFQPLAYSTVRYGIATIIFTWFTFGVERSFQVRRRDLALVVATAATWAAYTVAIAPLMRSYSPYRISALVLAIGWAAVALTGISQTAHQSFDLSGLVWVCLGYAILGPLVLTNILWFRAV